MESPGKAGANAKTLARDLPALGSREEQACGYE
jgi:hypothetical protein